MGGPGLAAYDGVTWADAHLIDGAVNGVGEGVRGVATGGRKIQSGNLRNYAAAIGCGAVLVLAWFVVVRGLL
jgi:NADH-quinone oxidoreductase subunit L